jgi:hypothetical protein
MNRPEQSHQGPGSQGPQGAVVGWVANREPLTMTMQRYYSETAIATASALQGLDFGASDQTQGDKEERNYVYVSEKR